MSNLDTIYALSSGALPSGVAVIRISGGETRNALRALAGTLPSNRQAAVRLIRNRNDEVLDRGLVLFFAGPHSFTGEDAGELHLHGGRAVVEAVLGELSALPGLRAAEAGEFTRRAFLNGKVDLTSAEALADLVSAETEAQRRFALANSRGRQAELYEDWRRRLLHARAMVEAELDFSDQEDVPGSLSGEVWTDVSELRRQIKYHIQGFRSAEIIRDGLRVVIVGAPNAGKSSLLNALAKRDVAIVSEIAGTTRDLIEVALDVNGYKIVVTDTAGLRADADKVEQLGIERALSAAAQADLVVELYEEGAPALGCFFRRAVDRLRVGSKADRVLHKEGAGFDVVLSSHTGVGVDDLLARIGLVAEERAAAVSSTVPSRRRHVALLQNVELHLGRALEVGAALELTAEELRLGGEALGKITGAADVEALLGEIFGAFCIGK